jgi:16S rRNA processing protein RimM
MQEAYVNIGYTQKTHGVAGELKVFVLERYWEDFLKNERFFLDVKGVKVPYFVENLRGGGTPIVKFEDVDTREAAIGLQSRELFLRREDLVPEHERELEVEADEGLEFSHLLGFQVTDETLGDLGVIGEIVEIPQQEMAVLHYRGREVLVPLNRQFIRSVDEAGKKVVMDLPEGLMDL